MTDLKLRYKYIKILVENIIINLYDLVLRKAFLDMASKPQATKKEK